MSNLDLKKRKKRKMSNLDFEKSKKETEYIKIHETEKNNYSLSITNRRSKILKDLLYFTLIIYKITLHPKN